MIELVDTSAIESLAIESWDLRAKKPGLNLGKTLAWTWVRELGLNGVEPGFTLGLNLVLNLDFRWIEPVLNLGWLNPGSWC